MYSHHARWGEQIVYIVLILLIACFTKFFFWLGVAVIVAIVLIHICNDLWEGI